MPDHPPVWVRASGARELWHRQRDPDLARGWRELHPDRRTACGADLAEPVTRAATPATPACIACVEINDYEARFPPT